jgi:hypothetical protein
VTPNGGHAPLKSELGWNTVLDDVGAAEQQPRRFHVEVEGHTPSRSDARTVTRQSSRAWQQTIVARGLLLGGPRRQIFACALLQRRAALSACQWSAIICHHVPRGGGGPQVACACVPFS